MRYRCARCHTVFSSNDELPVCPTCRAQSGIEPVHAPSLAMRLFGAVLGTAAVVALTGGILARLGGA